MSWRLTRQNVRTERTRMPCEDRSTGERHRGERERRRTEDHPRPVEQLVEQRRAALR